MTGIETGALALDARLGKVGRVMDRIDGRYYLRPPAGGREWEAAVEAVQQDHADVFAAAEELRASLGEQSRR
jgi:hypothetical protein